MLGLTAIALAATLALSGCVSWFLPPEVSSTSTPTDETVDVALEPFYRQVLVWQPCDGKQCTTAVAPLDWQNPGGATIELALVRQPATSDERQGSLFVNPGGPGASGFSFVQQSVDFATDERLQAAYDVVGFDPRGVGRSSPVRCHDDPAELDAYLYGVRTGAPGSAEYLAEQTQRVTAFGARCLELTGDLLANVDTPSVARDLDMLRAVVGDEKLHYLGYSYGTLIGAVYADLFPHRVGRMVLDGALDPSATEFEMTLAQAQGFEGALDRYLAACVERSGCPFEGSASAASGSVAALLDDLVTNPLEARDGRMLTPAAMFAAIILPLYNTSTWPRLDELFGTVQKGDPEFAMRLADDYNGREGNGGYPHNATEAFVAIGCLDERTPADDTTLQSQAAQLEKSAPALGLQMAWGSGCSAWPVPERRQREPIVAPGSPDILVVGTTGDPATPYEWSVTLAGTLDNGHLLTYEGEGHTAYNKSNACVNTAVDDFLVSGTLPGQPARC